MSDYFIITAIIIGFLPSIFIYSRNYKWNNTQFKFWISVVMSLLAILTLFIFKERLSYSVTYMLFSLPCYFAIETLFTKISMAIHKRDFYLYLRNSDDINGEGWLKHNKHIKTSDIILSIILLFSMIGFVVLGIVTFFVKPE